MSQAKWDRSTIGAPGRFEGRLVVVAGASPGIGRAVGAAFAAEGGQVFFCSRGAAPDRRVEAALRAAGGAALCVRVEVLRDVEVEAFIARPEPGGGEVSRS